MCGPPQYGEPMATSHRTFTFSSVDMGGIADEMRTFGTGSDGRRWVNVEPDADENEIHTGSIFWRMFSSRGPVIPKLTWLPTHPTKAGVEPAQLGLAHATGKQAIERLTELGVTMPAGFHPVQDHQKRGVIFALEPGVDELTILEYGTAAIRALSPFGFEDSFIATFSNQ